MGRIRTFKPEMLRHKGLQALGAKAMLTFLGLISTADREGRFVWDLDQLGLDILPFLPGYSLGSEMAKLEGGGFIQRYQVGGRVYGVIPSFHAHQTINHREAASKIPPPPEVPPAHAEEAPLLALASAGMPGHAREDATESHLPGHALHASRACPGGREGKGREGKEKDPGAPSSLRSSGTPTGEGGLGDASAGEGPAGLAPVAQGSGSPGRPLEAPKATPEAPTPPPPPVPLPLGPSAAKGGAKTATSSPRPRPLQLSDLTVDQILGGKDTPTALAFWQLSKCFPGKNLRPKDAAVEYVLALKQGATLEGLQAAGEALLRSFSPRRLEYMPRMDLWLAQEAWRAPAVPAPLPPSAPPQKQHHRSGVDAAWIAQNAAALSRMSAPTEPTDADAPEAHEDPAVIQALGLPGA